MTGEEIKPRGSHRVTNDVVFNLIKSRITRESTVLDFGAGNGHMSQRVGSAFEEMGEEPDKHLFACEIAPDQFLYSKVACQRISTDSVIPYADDTFDLIYAIEVLEHTPRPYDFFDQAYSKLKQGGWLVFSVPNILHFKSRLKILFTGYGEMYGPLSSDTRNAGRICGHIMPLSYSNFR